MDLSGPATQAKIEALLKAPATDYKKMYEDEKKKRESAERKLAEIKKIIVNEDPGETRVFFIAIKLIFRLYPICRKNTIIIPQ